MQATTLADPGTKRFRNGAFEPCKLFDLGGFIAHAVEKLWEYFFLNVEKLGITLKKL